MARRSLMGKIFCIGVCMVTLLCFAAQGQAAADPLQELYQAAKKEGKVVNWGPTDPKEWAFIVNAFKKKYPGIEVEYFESRPENWIPRAIAEAAQGRVNYDIGQGRMSTLTALLDRDLIQSHKDWLSIFKDMSPSMISENGKLITWYNMIYPVAYNTKLVKPEDVPKTWEDLLDPKWSGGKILQESTVSSFAYVGLKWGEKRLVSYVEKLRNQKPIFVRGGTTVIQQLAAGVAPLAVGTYLQKIEQGKKLGQPVECALKITPVGASTDVNYIPKGAPHPNAAKLLMGYMSSPEGLKVMLEGFGKGTAYPGSITPGVAELYKNKVEVIFETPENFKAADEMNRLSVQAMGILK